jgi:hypothetical protein
MRVLLTWDCITSADSMNMRVKLVLTLLAFAGIMCYKI